MSLSIQKQIAYPSDIAIPAVAAEPTRQVDLGTFSQDLLNGIQELHAAFGPIAAVEDGGLRVVFLFSPDLNQQVLSDTQRYHARFFAVRGPKNSAQRRLTCGLLSMNGDQHRRNRRLVKEPFGLKAIATYDATIERLTDELLATWKVGEVRDIAEEMRKFMLRLTSTLLFGLEQSDAAYRLGDMIAEWVEMNDRLGAGALVPNAVFSEHYEVLLGFADRLEGEIRQLIRHRRESQELGGDVLSILVRQHDEQGGLSDEEMVGQAAVLFSAAHMTTAHSLTWTMFLLAQHPTVMERLWEEWQRDGADDRSPKVGNCGCEESGDDGADKLSFAERVIKESMRLLPASAYSQRINVEAVRLGPLRLTRGTGIVFTPLVTHRLPEIYSEPNRFLPDRWLTLKPSPYAYHPFGAGARMCIGGPLAMAIVRTSLRKILTRFRLRVVPGADISAHIESTMLMPTHGMPMILGSPDGKCESSTISGNIHELVEFPAPSALEAATTNGSDYANAETNGRPRQPR